MSHDADAGRPGFAAAMRGPWLPLGVLVVATLAVLLVALKWHRTPSYGSETDLIGDLIPAARSLRAGRIAADNFQFKGPGYPLLLAAAGSALGGDDWLAARLLNVVSAAAGAWFVFLIAERFLSAGAGLLAMLGLFASPIWLRAVFEAGTDMPAFAISMASTWLVLSRTGRGAWLQAGLLSGFAYLTRYNAISLLPAAAVTALFGRQDPGAGHAVASRSSRWALLASYAAGFVAMVSAWALVGRLFGTGVMENRNYLNVAYEVYGHGLSWDNYWSDAGRRFHSLYDVVRFDPARMAQVLSQNVALRWRTDIRVLIPIWIGIPAVLGMLSVWPGRRGALPIAAHFGFAYLVLAGVFYSQRFFLYLIPFYLMGAAALLFHSPHWPWAARRADSPPLHPSNAGPRRRRGSRPDAASRVAHGAWPRPRVFSGRPWLSGVLGAALLVPSGWTSVQTMRRLLSSEPYETRDAGELLRRFAPAGGRVMARKPHVAYFAGMDYVPMPPVETIGELMAFAAQQHVDYLLYTGLEVTMRQQLLLLADPGLQLPGLEQIAYHAYPSQHFYALYRFTRAPIDTAHFAQAVLDRSIQYAARNPMSSVVQTFVGGLFFDHGRQGEGLQYLERAHQLDPSSVPTVAIMALSYFAIGDDARAGQACEEAIGLGNVSASIHALRGLSRASAGHWDEAREAFRDASSRDPANPRLLLMYGVTLLTMGDRESGARALDRCVAFAPELAAYREKALGTFGDGGRADAALVQLHRIMRSQIFSPNLRDLTQDWQE